METFVEVVLVISGISCIIHFFCALVWAGDGDEVPAITVITGMLSGALFAGACGVLS
jgi:hypothetical protein